MGAHLIDGQFQSDKYPTTPAGKVPLSVRDETAQDLLWEYARRRRAVDAEFSDDLETALRAAGYPAIRRVASLDELRDAILAAVVPVEESEHARGFNAGIREAARAADAIAGQPGDVSGADAGRPATTVLCASCEKRPAACFGSYEGCENAEPTPACEECCGHGCEDGWCIPIGELARWATTAIRRVADELQKERDAARQEAERLLEQLTITELGRRTLFDANRHLIEEAYHLRPVVDAVDRWRAAVHLEDRHRRDTIDAIDHYRAYRVGPSDGPSGAAETTAPATPAGDPE